MSPCSSWNPPKGYVRLKATLDVQRQLAQGLTPPVAVPLEAAEPGVVHVLPSASLGSGVHVADDQYSAHGMDALGLIRTAYGLSRPRTVVNTALPDGLYDVFLRMPEGEEGQLWGRLMSGLRQKLEEEFGITAHTEEREMEVYALTAPQGRPEALSSPAVKNQASATDGQFRNMSIASSLVGTLESALKRPVLDQTGLKGRYDFEFTCERGTAQSVMAAVQEQLGLELSPAKRSIKVLIVE